MAYVIFTTLAVLMLSGAVALMAVLYLRERSADERAARQDLANAMILFQSMRDVLEEQKELARAFNESIDKRIALIRKAAGDLERLRAETPENGALDDRPVEGPDEPLPEADALEDEEDGAGPLNVFPEPEPHMDPEDDLIDAWAGLDLGRKTPRDPAEDAEREPVSPEEAEDARDAVRSLLDMDDNEIGADEALVRMPGRGNGTEAMPPALHSRVYEYHDAGMSVPQIAQELGLGKGEVRLMLSLRKDKES